MISFDDLLSSDDDESDHDSDQFIKHLRKCFIAIDDNSCCESSLLPDLRLFNQNTHEAKGTNTPLTGENLRSILCKRIDADSYDYTSFMGRRNTRKPSFKTTQRQQQEKSKLNETIGINSRYPWSSNETTTSKEDLFQANQKPVVVSNMSNFISGVSESLLSQSNEQNHFLDYNQFESMTPDSIKDKTIKIFLPMCDKSVQEKASMNISVYKTAKISDLIGLICFKYINEKRVPNLKYKSVNDYCLKIAEENGEIELDLSALEMNTFVSKFDFSHLAFVENVTSNRDSTQPKKVDILIHFLDDSPDEVLTYETIDIKMSRIFEDLCKKKLETINIYCPLISYRLEHNDEPGVSVDLEANLTTTYRKYEFFFFRQNSARTYSLSNQLTIEPTKDPFIRALENTEFNLVYLSKWSKVPFKIELSIDSIILEEIKTSHLSLTGKKTSNFYSIPLMYVCACIDIIPKSSKATSHSQIRIIVAELNELNDPNEGYLYKHLDFECETKIAQDIKSTMSSLILYCDSPIAIEYNTSTKPKITSKWSRKLYNLKKGKKTSL